MATRSFIGNAPSTSALGQHTLGSEEFRESEASTL
jgi:hypothetical protein